MICFPNAKINLGLSVKEKRIDGMHNIETCYIPIPIYDILEINLSDNFSLVQSGLPLPVNSKNNLITKAWNLLLSVKKDIKPARVYLYKNIPVGSGLGGGSSDAAFFLTAMNKIQSLGFTINELLLLASEIGADCPFFIVNQPTVATGIGDIFTPIKNPVQNMYITVIFPNICISTKNAFAKIVPIKGQKLVTIIYGKNTAWKSELKNDFEEIAITDFLVLKDIKNTLYKLGAVYASLSGSGSAIYALSKTPLNTTVFGKKYRIWSEALVLD